MRLDFPCVPKDSRIVVAMSGGVDSSTVVALLQRAGYCNIIGMTLLLYENDEDKGIVCRDQTIIDDCKKVAKTLNIEHHFIDLKEKFFQEIINPFLDGYLSGITYNPCITCNRDIKFGALLAESEKVGADVLVTGHYIKWDLGPDGKGSIHKGLSQNRDQSYFLAQTRKSSISKIRFPLANFTKVQTRELASCFGLHVADKPSSKDLCFVGGNSYAKIFEKATKEVQSGDIITKNGEILGRHEGIHNFTVGQRKGLGISVGPEPLYVVDIDAKNSNVIVGYRKDLAKREIIIRKVNWLGEGDFSFTKKMMSAKVRASQIPTMADVYPVDEESAKVVFHDDVFGIARGQVCAFYDDTRLLGGGYI